MSAITLPFIFYQGTDTDIVCNLADAQTGAGLIN
jgi:hypothetical protein